MRLDFRNIGKGLEAIAGAKKARDLAQESARYDVTEGAYGPGLQENIQQLQSLREQDPAQAAAYDQAIGELTRRQGLTAPDYSVASGPTDFATRQEARQAAAPLRAEGLAGVYRRYGDVERADALEARAFELQRGLMQEKRAQIAEERAVAAEADRVARRPLELEDLQTRTAAGKLGLTRTQQEIDTGALTLADRQRAATAAKNMDNFNVAFGEANAVAQAEGRVLNPRDIADLAKANKLNFTQENELIASQVNRSKAEVEQFRLDVEKVTQGKGFESLVDLHKNDKRFGDGMHFVPEIDKKTGGVTMARVNEATGQVEERLRFKTKAEATAYLREEAVNPANAAVWLQNYQKVAANIAESEAGTKLKNAQAGAVGLEKLSPLEKNLNTLKRLNIPVTDAQIKTMVLGAQKDPALEAELAAITKIAGSDTANPKVLAALPGQIQAALARSKGREIGATILTDLIRAQADGKGAEAIAALRKKNMPEPELKAAAEQAGVTYIAPPAAATQPQTQSPTGLTRGAQPAPYVPPAGSRAAIAQEARAQATATQAESARLAAQAQSRLATDFAADARTLSPTELVRKYDKVRGQLPRDQALELQTIQRNIR